MADYDSRPDTLEHIAHVRACIAEVVEDLAHRAEKHDRSKLEPPEVDTFDEYTPKLRASTYGSEEYARFLEGMGDGLAHHYAENDHHPEYGDGTVGWMNLMQVVEMLCDWKAATLRHADGDLRRSIEQNAERFKYGDEMTRLLMNTADALGWLHA